MGSFPMCVENSFCDKPLPKYLASKTVLIYCPHPVPFLNFLKLQSCPICNETTVKRVFSSQLPHCYNVILLRSKNLPSNHLMPSGDFMSS